jgi:hypothetical protein
MKRVRGPTALKTVRQNPETKKGRSFRIALFFTAQQSGFVW